MKYIKNIAKFIGVLLLIITFPIWFLFAIIFCYDFGGGDSF